MKKNVMIILISVLSVLVLGLGVFIVYDKVINKDKSSISNEQTENNSEKIILYFYKNEESDNSQNKYQATTDYDSIKDKNSILGQYECKTSQCRAPVAVQDFDYTIQSNNALIYEYEYDGKEVTEHYFVLFDFKKGVLGKYTELYWLSKNHKRYEQSYLLARDMSSGKYGIIDKNANIIKKFEYDMPEKFQIFTVDYLNPTYYSIENNMIVNYKNKKSGITRITSDDIIVDYKYDAISLINDKYFKAYLNGKWYLYNLDTKEKQIEEGYDILLMPNEGYNFNPVENLLVAKIGDYLYIKDYNGNNLINEKIKDESFGYVEYTCCGNPNGISASVENNILTIKMDKENVYKGEKVIYEYNILNKTLIKK